MGVNSLRKTVTRQRRDCDLNPGPSAPESSTLTTRLPSHPIISIIGTYTRSNSVGGSRVLAGLLQSDGHRDVITVSDQCSEAADEKSSCCSRLLLALVGPVV